MESIAIWYFQINPCLGPYGKTLKCGRPPCLGSWEVHCLAFRWNWGSTSRHRTAPSLFFHTAASWGRPEKGWRLSQGFYSSYAAWCLTRFLLSSWSRGKSLRYKIASLRVDLHKIWSFVFQLFQLDISPIVAISLLGASFLDKSRRGFYCRADADFLASINAAARRCRLRAWRWMDGWDLAWLAMIYQPVNSVNMPKYMWKTTPYPSLIVSKRETRGFPDLFDFFYVYPKIWTRKC